MAAIASEAFELVLVDAGLYPEAAISVREASKMVLHWRTTS
jgi:hypothetical protein